MRRAFEEHASCGIGFLASRKGVAERHLVEVALDLCRQYDHRGAPGHGAGILLDIPWALLLDRFPEWTRAIAQRDVALGMFFLPDDARLRSYCVTRVEELAGQAGAAVLGWADVPFDVEALPPGSSARRTAPVVRQALVQRPRGMSEDGWFACRYLLRLALDEVLGDEIGDEFKLCSLSNRTVLYKGLAELSRISQLYPDLENPDFASRFVLFHSRYSTNTTAVWRRAQPFWVLAHNGEIATIRGNVAWIDAIGSDLVRQIVSRHPRLEKLARSVRSIIAGGGSDSANLDDMLLALLVGGMSLPQAIIALLPEAPSLAGAGHALHAFHRAMAVYLGGCDGPAAIVACDGDEAVAHLDRNGLRPLWIVTTPDYAIAASELTGTVDDLGPIEVQRLLGPGETVVVRLGSGDVLLTEHVHAEVARQPFAAPEREVHGDHASARLPVPVDLARVQACFGMTREDVDVVLAPLVESGKLAVGAMGDDTPPAALLDQLPRRIEDYFTLRFAQETSPPIDPLRDTWVFETGVALGDRSGLWSRSERRHFLFEHPVLAPSELAWLEHQPDVARLDLCFDAARGPAGIQPALERAVRRAVALAHDHAVVVVSDRGVTASRAPLPGLRLVSRLHDALVAARVRHRVGIVADLGVWDVHHCALLVSLGADAVCPWLGCCSAGDKWETYLRGVRAGLIEVMSMIGVTPASAYCGARLVEAVGLDRTFLDSEFAGVRSHFAGITATVLDGEWFAFHQSAFCHSEPPALVDVGEFRQRPSGRPHANDGAVVRAIHAASAYSRKRERIRIGHEAYDAYERLLAEREPITPLDLVQLKPAESISESEVEQEEFILWRFMAPGMSEGALSEPAHRAVARAMNILNRFCRMKFRQAGVAPPPGLGPFANSGEGGFEKARMGGPDGNRSVQYAGGRFTVTPETAARACEAEVKFAQGAKPGKGGQLPGGKVAPRIAHQRGCEPGFELVSPPVNHNLYSIEDVKLMLESWRHLNPDVACALKFVATSGVEMVAIGGVNAGANRLHLSDGCGGTGAAKRVDQKHAGVPVSAVLPRVHDMLVEVGVRDQVEISVDGGVQGAAQALKLFLLGADRVAFGTTLLMTLGCSMLRQCHLAGPQPGDATGRRRIGCTPGVATQDPALVKNFSGRPRNALVFLVALARAMRRMMAHAGIARLSEVIGRRDLLERRPTLTGKAALIDVSTLVSAPPRRVQARDFLAQSRRHVPRPRTMELEATREALQGRRVELRQQLTNVDRSVGVAAAGEIARRCGDRGLPVGSVFLRHDGTAGHFYAAYAVHGLEFELRGLAADSCFTAAYGGRLVIIPENGNESLTVVGNTFAYGARGGEAFIAGRGGNRFAICLRRNHEGGAPTIVVQGVEANAFQYMTGGTALVLGTTGFNLGSGMTGGVVYLLDYRPEMLNGSYVQANRLQEEEAADVQGLLRRHAEITESRLAADLLRSYDPARFVKVTTRLVPHAIT